MKIKEAKSLKIFLIFFGISSCLPLVQNVFHPLIINGLDGAVLQEKPPVFDIENWSSSRFQQNSVKYIKENTAFRPDFIRISNQLDYWFFNEINTILTLGKENYIFDPNYIIARKGADYLSSEKRISKAKTIEKVGSFLDSLNIPILYCIAPNKANFYSDFLPNNTPLSEQRNQLFYEYFFKEKELSYINFDTYLYEQKTNFEYPLIPKYGAHWSIFGAYVSVKEIINSINTLVEKSHIKIVEEEFEISDKTKFTDADYLRSLNLIKAWQSPEMCYPKLKYEVDNKPNVLIVSDSFFWTFYDIEMVQNCFSKSSEMWYYNKSKHNILREKIGDIENKIALNDIKERDIIIVLSSTPGLKDFGYGFLEQLADLSESK
jgi:hypothetical protein